MTSTAVLGCGFLLFLLLLTEHRAATTRKCLNYSWLGSNYDFFNESWVVNRSSSSQLFSLPGCKDFPKPKPIPCVSPFIVLQDGEDLNTTDLIFKYGDKVLCEPGTGDVCAVVVYFYANKVFNVSAYCTRVTVEGTKPMQNGCETATAQVQGFKNTVCACYPFSNGTACNGFIPNSSTMIKLPPGLLMVHFIIAILIRIVHEKLF